MLRLPLIALIAGAVLAACGASAHNYGPPVATNAVARMTAFSPPPWGMSDYASPGPGVYQICNRTIYYPAKSLTCGSKTIQAKAFTKTASAIASPCGTPYGPGNCVISATIGSKLGTPSMTASVSVTPGPFGDTTEATQNLSTYWRDNLTVSSTTLPIGSPATVRITETVTVGAYNAPCNDIITGNNVLSITASASVWDGTNSTGTSLSGSCQPFGSFAWSGGLTSAYFDFPVVVGGIYSATGSLQIGLDVSDAGNNSPADRTSSVTNALAKTSLTPTTAGVTLTYASGKVRY